MRRKSSRRYTKTVGHKKKTSYSYVFYALLSLLIIGVLGLSFMSGWKRNGEAEGRAVGDNKGRVFGQSTRATSNFCITAPVLLYHHIEPYPEALKDGHANLTVDVSYFEQHLQYLHEKGYLTISAEELVNALINLQEISGKPVVITIDDGYSDLYTYVFPLLKKYQVKASVMIATGLLEKPGYVTWRQLLEMVSSGLVDAYAHTWSHFSLPNADEAKIEGEIMRGKRELEEKLGKRVDVFAYPYGTFNDTVIEILKKTGFRAAFATTHSFLQCSNSIYFLNRNHVGNTSLSYYGL